MNCKLPTRTDSGYEMGGFEAVGLPPRQSQQLLCLVNDMSPEQSAQVLNCSKANIYQLNDSLRWKHKTKHQGGLVAAALKSGTLRLLTLLLAGFISTGATQQADAESLNGDSDADEQRIRFRSRPRRDRNTRTRMQRRSRLEEILWDDENNTLTVSPING